MRLIDRPRFALHWINNATIVAAGQAHVGATVCKRPPRILRPAVRICNRCQCNRVNLQMLNGPAFPAFPASDVCGSEVPTAGCPHASHLNTTTTSHHACLAKVTSARRCDEHNGCQFPACHRLGFCNSNPALALLHAAHTAASHTNRLAQHRRRHAHAPPIDSVSKAQPSAVWGGRVPCHTLRRSCYNVRAHTPHCTANGVLIGSARCTRSRSPTPAILPRTNFGDVIVL
jgi:hypothetical protein